jgi:predicted dienelactone hydrolase
MKRPDLTRRTLLFAGVGAAGLLAAGCAVHVASSSTGERPGFDDARSARDPGEFVEREGYRHVELDWVDARRQRAVPVRLYLPAARSPEPLPLVLFSHGMGGSRRGYSYLGAHFARSGYASLHVQHVGSDRSVWVGSPLEITGRLQAAAADAEAVNRVADLRFALDRVLDASASDAWRFAADLDRVIAAGHSYGANSSLLISGAQVERDGKLFDLRDARIRAALLLSAPPFYGAPAMEPILRPIALPSLHVTTTADDIRVPGYYSPAADRVAVFNAIGGRPRALAVFAGGEHSIFTDRTGPGGPELNARVKAATQELAVAFLAKVFDARGEALADWRERHQPIVARFALDTSVA